MTVSYHINPEQKIVFTSVCDVVDGPQLYAHQDRLRVDPGFEPDMCELMDCMNLQDVKLSTVNHLKLVKDSPWGVRAKRAILVPNPLVFGIIRFFQVFMSPSHGKISIFHNPESARNWLETNLSEVSEKFAQRS